MKNLTCAILLSFAACAAPALAQNGRSDWDKIVLEDKAGNVMTSTGGEYQTAAVGKLLSVGEYMMLSGDQAVAKVVYYELDDNGNVVNKCTRDYTDPNTYIIDASCVPAAAWTSGKTGAVVGAAVVAALLLGSDETEPGPISTGRRN